ncbi:hypothetical protein [Collinsella ihumii]|uniref:hypothetical protein n=1 Tax=Collinsella ihumii TaxID=1720204 RepID=UPI0025AB2D95|nr:hypothetical protein [Collinsella ihumii]MDN0055552.1 hypothetical protein [Collinsella ihumii]
MSAWTTGQEELLRELGHLGAEAVREEMRRRFGVERSRRSIEVHASRIHVSLRRLEVCPMCGAVGVHLNRQSGACSRCTVEMHVAEEAAFNEILELEARGCEEGPELEAARREWARLRQRNSRLMRKHGLRGKRGR